MIAALLVLVLSVPHAGATTGPGALGRVYGGTGTDDGVAIAATPDGGYALAGNLGSFGRVANHAWVLRFDVSGLPLWSQLVLPASAGTVASDLQALPDGGFLLAGSIHGGGDELGDGLVARLDPAGRLLWHRVLGGARIDLLRAVRALPDGGAVAVGETESAGTGESDAWIVRLDSAGAVVWERTMGGPGRDTAAALTVLHDGSLLVAGSGAAANGRADAWLARVDGSGQTLWQRDFGGPNDEDALALVVTAAGEAVVALQADATDVSAGTVTLWRVGLDGTMRGHRSYGIAGAHIAYGLAAAGDGLLVTGSLPSPGGPRDGWLLRLDRQGNVLWTRTAGDAGEDELFAAAEIGGRVVAVGRTEFPGHGESDLWVMETATDGTLIQAPALSAEAEARRRAVAGAVDAAARRLGIEPAAPIEMVESDGGLAIAVPLLGIEAGPGRGGLDLGIVRLALGPRAGGRVAVSVVLPGDLHGREPDGTHAFTATVRRQRAEGSWDLAIEQFVAFAGELGDIVVRGGETLLEIGAVSASGSLAPGGDGRWSGPGAVEVSRIRLVDRGRSPLSIARLLMTVHVRDTDPAALRTAESALAAAAAGEGRPLDVPAALAASNAYVRALGDLTVGLTASDLAVSDPGEFGTHRVRRLSVHGGLGAAEDGRRRIDLGLGFAGFVVEETPGGIAGSLDVFDLALAFDRVRDETVAGLAADLLAGADVPGPSTLRQALGGLAFSIRGAGLAVEPGPGLGDARAEEMAFAVSFDGFDRTRGTVVLDVVQRGLAMPEIGLPDDLMPMAAELSLVVENVPVAEIAGAIEVRPGTQAFDLLPEYLVAAATRVALRVASIGLPQGSVTAAGEIRATAGALPAVASIDLVVTDFDPLVARLIQEVPGEAERRSVRAAATVMKAFGEPVGRGGAPATDYRFRVVLYESGGVTVNGKDIGPLFEALQGAPTGDRPRR